LLFLLQTVDCCRFALPHHWSGGVFAPPPPLESVCAGWHPDASAVGGSMTPASRLLFLISHQHLPFTVTALTATSPPIRRMFAWRPWRDCRMPMPPLTLIVFSSNSKPHRSHAFDPHTNLPSPGGLFFEFPRLETSHQGHHCSFLSVTANAVLYRHRLIVTVFVATG